MRRILICLVAAALPLGAWAIDSDIAFDSPAGRGLSSAAGEGARSYFFNTIDNVEDGMSIYTAGDPVRAAFR